MKAIKFFLLGLWMLPVMVVTAQENAASKNTVIEKVQRNAYFSFVKNKALEVMKS